MENTKRKLEWDFNLNVGWIFYTAVGEGLTIQDAQSYFGVSPERFRNYLTELEKELGAGWNTGVLKEGDIT